MEPTARGHGDMNCSAGLMALPEDRKLFFYLRFLSMFNNIHAYPLSIKATIDCGTQIVHADWVF
jgi:hypothetical protein